MQGNNIKFSNSETFQHCGPIDDRVSVEKINSLNNCCSSGGNLGCWNMHFVGNDGRVKFDDAVLLFNECQELTRNKNRFELDSFVQEKFRESIVSEKIQEDGTIQFNMAYYIRQNMKVCKKAYAMAFGITVYHLERCSAALKESTSRRVNAITVREYSDSHIHSYNYLETENLFKANLPEDIVGKEQTFLYTSH